jgi:hypothetical protein
MKTSHNHLSLTWMTNYKTPPWQLGRAMKKDGPLPPRRGQLRGTMSWLDLRHLTRRLQQQALARSRPQRRLGDQIPAQSVQKQRQFHHACLLTGHSRSVMSEFRAHTRQKMLI